MEAVSAGANNIDIDLGVFGSINVDVDNWFDVGGDILNLVPSVSTIGPPRKEEQVGLNGELIITYSDLQIKCEKAAALLRDAKDDLDTVKVNDSSFNVTSEAKDLAKVPSAIERMYNNLLQSSDSLTGNALAQSAGLDGLFSPEIKINFKSTKIGQVIEKIIIKGETIPIYEPNSGTLIRPLNRERTANYLYNINKMMLTPLIGGVPDCNVSTGVAGSAFILRYTKGLTIRDAKDTPYQPIHQWADETFIEPIEEIAQDIKTTSKNKGEYDWFFSGANYSSAAALPIISQTCTLAEVKHKFLDTFDLQAILCDVVACLRIPAFSIKAPSFYLPPKIGAPVFGLPDMRELSKKLADLISQILAKLLCVYANSILDILSTPFCDTALEEQLASSLFDAVICTSVLLS